MFFSEVLIFFKKFGEKRDSGLAQNIRVPILLLNKDYHDLFLFFEKTEVIIQLEKNLNNLLKEQGQLNNNLKKYQKMKKDLMSKILQLTPEVFDRYDENAKAEMKKSEKKIVKINNKLIEGEIRLEHIAYDIEKTNSKLLDECIKIYYKSSNESKKRVSTLDHQIEKLRTILKIKIDERSKLDEEMEKTYSLLHKIVGVDIINKLDEENMEE